jgi:hypothetical protein
MYVYRYKSNVQTLIGQLQTSVTLSLGKEPMVLIEQEADWGLQLGRTLWSKEKRLPLPEIEPRRLYISSSLYRQSYPVLLIIYWATIYAKLETVPLEKYTPHWSTQLHSWLFLVSASVDLPWSFRVHSRYVYEPCCNDSTAFLLPSGSVAPDFFPFPAYRNSFFCYREAQGKMNL